MKQNNGDLPAMPSGVLQDGHNCGEYPLNTGLTKREMFAMAALQGILSCDNSEFTNVASISAVAHADALLAELEK